MSEGNMPLLERLLTAGAASDWETVTGCVSPDFVIIEPEQLPYGGRHYGPAGFRKMIELYQATWADPQFDVTLTGEIGSTVLLKGVLRSASTATGKPIEVAVAEFFTVKDGLFISSEVFYADLVAVIAALTP